MKLQQGGMVKCSLSIDRCPSHGRYAISLNDEHGGTRLTSGKCCGLWRTIHEWEMEANELQDLIQEAKSHLKRIRSSRPQKVMV